MVSFALILMTLPSRVAGVRVGRANSSPDENVVGTDAGPRRLGARRGERPDISETTAAKTKEP